MQKDNASVQVSVVDHAVVVVACTITRYWLQQPYAIRWPACFVPLGSLVCVTELAL